MRRVVCLRTGDRYGPEYVAYLEQAVRRSTDQPVLFEVIREGARFPGWWQKLCLFPPPQRTVFLDLDVVLVDSVEFLFDYVGDFCVWGDPWNGKWNTSVMAIAPGFGAEIRDRFLEDADAIMRRLHGDQDFVAEVLWPHADTWQTVAPGKVRSYKADHLEAGPAGAAIVVFHGQPKPHELPPEHWARRAWEGQWASRGRAVR
jgi:hypothetical protein